MKITKENAQMLSPSVNKNPPTIESQAQIDARFIKNCKRGIKNLQGDTVETVNADLEKKALTLIKIELTTDPEKRGYAGKTAEEIVPLINDPYTVKGMGKQNHPDPARVELGEVIDVEIDIETLPRICHVWKGFPYVPNNVTVEDITKAMNNG